MSPSLVKILPARLLTLGEEYLISIFLPPMVLDSVAAGLCADARLAAAMSAPAHIERDFMVYSSLGRACQRAGSYSTSNEPRTPWWLLLLSRQSDNVLFGQSRNVLLTGSSLEGG